MRLMPRVFFMKPPREGSRVSCGRRAQGRKGALTPFGLTMLRLETNKALTEAITLYRSAGFREVAPFNDDPYAHHWFEKRLGRRR
jgi:hypothetical protein